MKIFSFIFLGILLVCSFVFSQDYSSYPLITQEGNNYDVNVLSPTDAWPIDSTYICWVNENDSVYTIYLKQISPTNRPEIIVARDSSRKSNPCIVRNEQNIIIAWQNETDDGWQIWFKTFKDDRLSSGMLFVDSLANDPQITMSSNRIAWIDSGRLLISEFNNLSKEYIIIDSLNCSSPDLKKEDNAYYSTIVYEKGLQDNKNVYLAELNTYVSQKWKKTKLSNGPGINPRLGFLDYISFQSFQDSIWTVLYGQVNNLPYDTVKISGCNLRNPLVFSYDVPTKENNATTYPFVAFEKDSTNSDYSDIVLKTHTSFCKDTFITVSKNFGKNYQPQIAFLTDSDSVKIAIIWINEMGKKKNIWIAESPYNPKIGNIERSDKFIRWFELYQNYPNPFNPVTNIKYFVSKPCNVSLSIYNILGERIKVFNEGFKRIGKYKIKFDGRNYPSGVYYYKLTSGKYSTTRSMVLIK